MKCFIVTVWETTIAILLYDTQKVTVLRTIKWILVRKK